MTEFEIGEDYTIALRIDGEDVYANYRVIEVALPLLHVEGPNGPVTIDTDGPDFISAQRLHMNPAWDSDVEHFLDKIGFGEGRTAIRQPRGN